MIHSTPATSDFTKEKEVKKAELAILHHVQ